MIAFDDYDRLDRGAIFSPCETFRYLLWRKWSAAKPLVVCMLNPSTADAEHNDPTVARCQKRAEEGGYGGLIVTNLFALRSTDPKALYRTANAVGPANNLAILWASKQGDGVFCGWGAHGSLRGRDAEVKRLLEDVPCWAWQLTKHRKPAHPLYLKYGRAPVALNAAARKVLGKRAAVAV